MRTKRQYPRTDAAKLVKDLKEKGAHFFLPHNLSDFWIRAFVRDLYIVRQAIEDERDYGDQLFPIMLVLTAIEAKARNISHDEVAENPQYLEGKFELYSILLVNELIGRQTGIYLDDPVADLSLES